MAAEMLDGKGQGGASPRRVVRRFVTQALAEPTGLELLARLTQLSARDDLSTRERVEVAKAWNRMESYCAAGKLSAVLDVDRSFNPSAESTFSPLVGEGGNSGTAAPGRSCSVRPAADELAPVLGISPQSASALVALARRVESMPAAADALAEGRMRFAQLRVTDQVVRDLPPSTAPKVEAAAVAWAPRKTVAQLRIALASEAARLDPEHASTAAARGVTERDVSWRPSPIAGCRRLVADLPLVDGAAAWHTVNTAAKNAKKAGVRPDGTPEDRTLAQLRADLLTALLTGQVDSHGAHVPAPEELTRLAEVHVVVAHDSLTGHSDLPGHLPGVGPVDLDTVRDLAARTPLRRLIVDSGAGTLLHRDDRAHAPLTATGDGPRSVERPGERAAERSATDPRLGRMLTDPVGPTGAQRLGDDSRYRPPALLRAFVQTRDATCLGPACSHPTTGSQLDHTINHGGHDANGVLGATTAGNLGSLCERVHNAKTHGGWHLDQPSPGAFVWTSPTGRTYSRTARPLVPGWHHRRRKPPHRATEP